jgi:hypothetical protein
MAIPPEGTFEYVAVVPDGSTTSFSCAARLRKPPGSDGSDTARLRLLGPTPRLHVSEAGATPNPGPRNPATQRSRLRLISSEKTSATIAEASFFLDKGVISALRAGDLLHMARTSCGRIGVSAIRSEQLIFAVGAIGAVPLGSDFQARFPNDLVREAEAVFQKRDSGFEFAEYPVEIRAVDERYIGYGGRRKLGALEVWILHGHYNGTPGKDACLSVARTDACPVVGANISALFLDTDALEMIRW